MVEIPAIQVYVPNDVMVKLINKGNTESKTPQRMAADIIRAHFETEEAVTND